MKASAVTQILLYCIIYITLNIAKMLPKYIPQDTCLHLTSFKTVLFFISPVFVDFDANIKLASVSEIPIQVSKL